MKTNKNTLLGIFVLFTIVIITIATLTLGCAENPDASNSDNTENYSTGNSSDNATNMEYIYEEAVVEGTNIIILESFPVKVNLEVNGYLPDGCTELEEEKTVDFDPENNKFTVDLITRRPVDAMCTEALVPYETTIALDVHGLEKGVYIVEVNGVLDEFELQTDNILTE